MKFDDWARGTFDADFIERSDRWYVRLCRRLTTVDRLKRNREYYPLRSHHQRQIERYVVADMVRKACEILDNEFLFGGSRASTGMGLWDQCRIKK